MAARANAVEVVEPTEVLLSADEARALTDQIAEATRDLWSLVERAYTERAWAALGYESWDAYIEAEFPTARFRLPREERQEVITSLREAGLSMRAIATATGVGRGTVERELADVPNGTTEPETITTTDGKQRAARNGKARPPTGEKAAKEPKAKKSKTLELLTISRPDGSPFEDGLILYGNSDLGALCPEEGVVRMYLEGSYEDFSVANARLLASCLLAAAEA